MEEALNNSPTLAIGATDLTKIALNALKLNILRPVIVGCHVARDLPKEPLLNSGYTLE